MKYVLADIVEELGMNISNLEDTRSRRDYNRYRIEYKSAFEIGGIPISSFVLVETSFTAVPFPAVMMAVTNYIGGVMEEAPEMIGEYHIGPFEMKVQGLDCTLTDKVFVICDYYMQNRIKKHSRHIYDIYKLLPLVDIPVLLQLITEEEIYKDDYQNLTKALLEEDVSYETAVRAVEKIRVSGIFEKC